MLQSTFDSSSLELPDYLKEESSRHTLLSSLNIFFFFDGISFSFLFLSLFSRSFLSFKVREVRSSLQQFTFIHWWWRFKRDPFLFFLYKHHFMDEKSIVAQRIIFKFLPLEWVILSSQCLAKNLIHKLISRIFFTKNICLPQWRCLEHYVVINVVKI